MSLYYLTVKNINRSSQSAVASAAYRSSDKLYSERDLETKSYKEREVKPESHIIAPSYAPDWVYDRERLWNEVEKIENRWNSRLAKEILVALPIELDNKQQTNMLVEFVNENFIDQGLVADISIHRDVEHNPHAHIMITTRPFEQDGEWGQKKKRDYIYDKEGNHVLNKYGEKKFRAVGTTNLYDKQALLNWRKNFAEKINLYYEQEGIQERVSHKSYEDQGLDKLPRHRLSREAYQIEKEVKETAKNENREYHPRTFYAKLNTTIEETNQKIKSLSEKVVSLTNYREAVKSDTLSELDKIRNSKNLTSEDWKSLKVVAKRVNGFVDIRNAKSNLVKLENWKRKLDYQVRFSDATEKVLLKAKYTHETEPSKTLLYGIIPNKFEEQFNRLSQDHQVEKDKMNRAQSVYKELYDYSLRAYEIQKEFTNEEFAYLYPNYHDQIGDNEATQNIKAKYVQQFREDGIIRRSIPEFERDTYKLTDDYVELKKTLAEWKETNKSLVILERTKEKRKNAYSTAYNSYDREKIFNASVKYTEVRDQVQDREQHKLHLESSMLEEMKTRYPYATEKTLKEIPSNIMSKVLTLHLSQDSTGKLSKDLKLIEKQENKNNNYQKQDQTNSVGGYQKGSSMLGSLINSAKADEGNHDDDLEKRRRKKKKQKPYRHQSELEL